MVKIKGELIRVQEIFDEVNMKNRYELVIWFDEKPKVDFSKNVIVSQD